MLTDADIEALEEILFAEPWGEDAVDFFGFHGLVCASVVGPVDYSVDELFLLATGVDVLPGGKVPDVFSRCVQKLSGAMANALDMGLALELPEPEDDDPMNALENWCAGFIETFMEQEDAWMEAASEEEVGDLILPMLALSGLFEDEDFQNVRDSETLSTQMAEAIPDSLTDLYLLFHAPD